MKSSDIKDLGSDLTITGPGGVQGQLFHVEKQIEFNGVEMGVLENGIPYLSESGLARMCGIDRKVLNRLAVNWHEERYKGRGRQIDELLSKSGFDSPTLFLKSEHAGSEVNAYTEPVCMAILEYYAFISKEPRNEAVMAFRLLARESFRLLVYKAVGYAPEQRLLDSWKHFHDRVDLTVKGTPQGYFGVFREIAMMIVPMIRNGVMVSDKVVPDISVGRYWSDYWKTNNLDEKYGARCKYDHEYPDYYDQAKSNPQPSFAYPDAALGEFRAWLFKHYIVNNLPTYLIGQAKKGSIPATLANKVSLSLGGGELPMGKKNALAAPKKKIAK